MTVMRTELDFTATRTWIGFGLMCLGMFMAILDIQVVATSLPTIQNALAISPEAMSWIQTSYLIAEIIAIPLTGWLTRLLSMRWLFTAAIAFFTLASIGCAASDQFRDACFVSGSAGIRRRNADSYRVCRCIHLVPATHAGHCNDYCRDHGGARTDGRTCRRRLDHADLFLALAVSDQCHSGADCLRRHAVSFASGKYQISDVPSSMACRCFYGGRARKPGDRAQAVAARRVVFLHLRGLVLSERSHRRGSLFGGHCEPPIRLCSYPHSGIVLSQSGAC